MIFGIKHYRQYLLGRKFVIRSDHAALSYLMTAKDLIGQQARWVDLMSEFDYTIQHRAGVLNGEVDTAELTPFSKYCVSSAVSTVVSATGTSATPSTCQMDPGADVYGSGMPGRAR